MTHPDKVTTTITDEQVASAIKAYDEAKYIGRNEILEMTENTPQERMRAALTAAAQAGKPTEVMCGACGQPWTGAPCGQKDNGWQFRTCYPYEAERVEPPQCSRCGRLHRRLGVLPTSIGGDLSLEQLCRLSILFNREANLSINSPDHHINEWLKAKLAQTRAALSASESLRGQGHASPDAKASVAIPDPFRRESTPAPATPGRANDWQLVPKVPTEEMLNGARDWALKKYGQGIGNNEATACYQSMLAASPAPPAQSNWLQSADGKETIRERRPEDDRPAQSVEGQERRAPVQGYSAGIPWSMHLRAWDAYAKKHGRLQTAERLTERGGFGCGELDVFIPGWRDELSQIATLTQALAEAKAECDALEAECDRLREQYDDVRSLNAKVMLTCTAKLAEADKVIEQSKKDKP